MNSKTATRWVVALKPEAEPIIDALSLYPGSDSKRYPIYKDKSAENWLVISGIGQANAKAAANHLHKESLTPPWAGWINLGIAGSGFGDYGQMYLVDKISSELAINSLFPGVALSSDLPRSGLLTVKQPKTDYEGKELIDMEGYGFCEAVNKFCCRELAIVLKVVSDGPNAKLEELNSEKISELISENLDKILSTISDLLELSIFEFERLTAPDEYQMVLARWHFTVSQEHQLINLLYPWYNCFPGKSLISHMSHCKNARSVIKHLSNDINSMEVDWGPM